MMKSTGARRARVVLALLAVSACGGDSPPARDPAITALQVELLDRVRADQAIRDSVFGRGLELDSLAVARMEQTDYNNTAWLKEQIRVHGWPSRAKVGKAAADAAFLIVQHATHDPMFQRAMLDTVTGEFQRGDVDGQQYALLFDRVTVRFGGKQRYGTQAKLTGKRVVFDPIEDSSRVDSLRAAVGLPSLEVYRRTLDSVYFGKARPKS
ncbi:MAG: DUF6624 domain-containing protein [Gemmatimonadaceae bacterium]